MKKILLAEDEKMLGGVIKDTLEIKGYTVSVATDGKDALGMYMRLQPDLLILDIMMPIVNGYDVATAVRKLNNNVPIIFLSAKGQTTDVLKGFDTGANDYVRKPFSMEELLARIQVLLREPVKNTNIYKVGAYAFDVAQQVLTIGSEKIHLSYKESELLKMLCNKINEVAYKDEVLMVLWGDNTVYNSRNLDVLITKLRLHLAKDEQIKIINLRGIGYKLTCGN